MFICTVTKWTSNGFKSLTKCEKRGKSRIIERMKFEQRKPLTIPNMKISCAIRWRFFAVVVRKRLSVRYFFFLFSFVDFWWCMVFQYLNHKIKALQFNIQQNKTTLNTRKNWIFVVYWEIHFSKKERHNNW